MSIYSATNYATIYSNNDALYKFKFKGTIRVLSNIFIGINFGFVAVFIPLHSCDHISTDILDIDWNYIGPSSP